MSPSFDHGTHPPITTVPPPSARDLVLAELARKVSGDPNLCTLLECSFISEKRDCLIAALRDLLPEEWHVKVKDVWSLFLTYCKENKDEIPLRINLAFTRKAHARATFKKRRYHFTESIGMHPKTKGKKLTGIQTIYLPKPRQEYPPAGYEIYEADATREIWEKHHATTLYPDRRNGKTWKPLLKLDPASLQHTVKTDESVIIREEGTNKLIGAVIRNFSNGNERLLDWLNGIVAENNSVRRNVRLEDPGRLCQIGYTAGARSDPELGWARNLLRKQTGATVDRLMYESSSAFAVFWNILRNQLPKEVNDDFETWLKDNEMVRMDTKGRQDSTQGEYTVKYGDDTFVFHGVDMPPPSGYFGTNYSRFMHWEKCGHTYGVSWTTVRNPKLGQDGGANFFMASHAVKVEAATDTVIVWIPSLWHGTSLQHQDPKDPEIFQAGLSIVTPPGVARLWAEVLDKKISLEEARKRVLEVESDETDA